MRDAYTSDGPIYKRRQTRVWFYFKEWKFTIMNPPKCGGSSIKQFIWMNELEDKIVHLMQNEAKKTPGENYVVIRNPLDRFASLWKNKCRDKDNIKDTEIYGMSPNQLMTHIENGHKDIHWTPQSAMIADANVKLIPLDMLGFWWRHNGLGELGVFNSTEGEVEIDNELKTRILTFYADDVILHNKAECDMCWDTCLKLNIQ